MSGVRQISGIKFVLIDGAWTAQFSESLKMTVNSNHTGKECFLYDEKDGSIFPFKTVSAAKAFAKRRRHGRTLKEHHLAETLQTTREKRGWSVKTSAEKLRVSPRTIEAWLSGARPVPQMVQLALEGC